MGLAILAFKGGVNAGGLSHQFIHFFEPFTDYREFRLPCKREVQVLGKTIVPEVADEPGDELYRSRGKRLFTICRTVFFGQPTRRVGLIKDTAGVTVL